MEESTRSPKKVTISESEEDSLKTTEDEESVKSIETNHDLLNNSEPFRPAIHIPENLYNNIKYSDEHAINWAKGVDKFITEKKLSTNNSPHIQRYIPILCVLPCSSFFFVSSII